MRKTFLFVLLMCLAVSMMAQTAWTVQTIPNTRLESNDIHVSDPDGYLSDSTEMTINTALCAIRDRADVFVVTLSSIGDAEPKHFATELFNVWGIGDADANNGVLLLFVEDQHALEFETGYGAEETLTDAKCQRIFTQSIVPYFRAGDYEGGLCAGVADIVTVYGGEVPMGLKTTLPTLDEDTDDDNLDHVGNYIWLGLFGLFLSIMPIAGLVFWVYKRKESKQKGTASDTFNLYQEDGVTYLDGFKSSWSGSPWEGKGCIGGLMLGLSIFVILLLVYALMKECFPEMEEVKLYSWMALITLLLYLTWICFCHNQSVLNMAQKLAKTSVNPQSVYQAAFDHESNKIAMWMAPWLGWIYYLLLKKKIKTSEECCCSQCGNGMSKDQYFHLPEIHEVENRVEALKFTPYRCGNGHVIVVKERGERYNEFMTCTKCGGFTALLTETKTTRKASYTQSGEKQKTFVCQHCGETIIKTVTTPMLGHYSDSSFSSSSGSRSHHSSSHHSSHGSFGGGHSGGGGFSGRW